MLSTLLTSWISAENHPRTRGNHGQRNNGRQRASLSMCVVLYTYGETGRCWKTHLSDLFTFEDIRLWSEHFLVGSFIRLWSGEIMVPTPGRTLSFAHMFTFQTAITSVSCQTITIWANGCMVSKTKSVDIIVVLACRSAFYFANACLVKLVYSYGSRDDSQSISMLHIVRIRGRQERIWNVIPWMMQVSAISAVLWRG